MSLLEDQQVIVIKESDITLSYELLPNPHYLGPLLGVDAITSSELCMEIPYENN